jgi:hypothetical protein
MIIKYRLISGENDDFVRDIEIHDDSTFIDLHLAIQSACDYDSSLLSTFYLSDKDWNKLDEIVLDRIDIESQADALLMEETLLDHFNPQPGQRYIYIFDFFSVRAFFIEIVNLRKSGKDDVHLEFPICTLSHGKAPKQIFIDDIDDNDLDDFDKFEEDIDDDDISFDNIENYDI